MKKMTSPLLVKCLSIFIVMEMVFSVGISVAAENKTMAPILHLLLADENIVPAPVKEDGLVGKWTITSYNIGFNGETGIIDFHNDHTFTIEGGTASVIAGCSVNSQCLSNIGTWDEVEDGIFMLVLNGADPSYLTVVNSNKDEILFTRECNLSIFKRVVEPSIVPVSDAGVGQTVKLGDTVTLDGTASSDDNGDSLNYKWTLIAKPPGSSTSLSSLTSARPTFIPDYSGEYMFSLIVNDGKFTSFADSVVILVDSPWTSLADEFGYTGPFSAETLDILPSNPQIMYSNSHYGRNGTLIADYENKVLSFIETVGPSDNRFVVAVDPQDDQHFVKLDNYVFWASHNAGITWEQISSSETFGHGDTQIGWNVKYLKFSPDGQALYLYSNGFGSSTLANEWLYSVSFDGGLTWNAPVGLSKGSGYGPITISSQDPSKVYIYGQDEMYSSVDRGLNWQVVTVPNSQYSNSYTTAFIADPFNANTVYVARKNVIYKTMDGAETWNELPIDLPAGLPSLPPTYRISINNYAQGLMYIAITFGEPFSSVGETTIIRSTDGGLTWTLLNSYGNIGLNTPYIVNIISGPPDVDGNVDLFIVSNSQIYHYVDKL